MHHNEFFDTGVYTHLWVMNKNKHQDPVRRGKVALIDGSGLWQLLKKAKGDKRREIPEEGRRRIVEALMTFESSDICKIYDREYFYYNKQSILLTEVSEKGMYVEQTICPDGKPFAIKHPVSLTVGRDEYADIKQLSADEVKQIAKRITEERLSLSLSVITEEGDVYAFVPDECTILHTDSQGKTRDLGCGMFSFKATVNKKGDTIYKISIEPYLESDYEIIPHHFDAEENNREIQAFMDKYVFKPYTLTTNKVGLKLNFSKEFYTPEEVSRVEDILAEIRELDPNASIKCYEIECSRNSKFNLSGVDSINCVPREWDVKRIKDVVELVSEKTNDNSMPYIGLENIESWTARYIPSDSTTEGTNNIFHSGDVLFGKLRPYLAKGYLPQNDGICSTEFFVLRPYRNVHNKYVLYFILSHQVIDYLKNQVAGVKMPRTNWDSFSNLTIPLPNSAEQQSIATYLDEKCSEIDANIANLEKQIEKYKELKRALISEVVTGKRRV